MSPRAVLNAIDRALRRPARATEPAQALSEARAQASQLTRQYQPRLERGTIRIVVRDSSPRDVTEDGDIDFEVSVNPKTRPAKPVKLKYLRKRGRGFELKPRYRGATAIRVKFYGSNRQSAAALRERDRKVNLRRRDRHGNPSPNGSYWEPTRNRIVSLSSPTDPTIEHNPPVVSHWNSTGRKRDQATRRAFFTFAGRESSIVVIDRSRNSQLGGRGATYNPVVTAGWSGPAEKR